MKSYGKELILDLHNCNPKKFTKYYIKKFFVELCQKIDMNPEKIAFWVYEDPEEYERAPIHLKGSSAIQFISTSNITIHALDELKSVYLNIFSCKDFDPEKAEIFCSEYFLGEVVNRQIITRE